jgi:bifunctional non-homologous end joining protein LigD
MLATAGTLPIGEGWVFEVKWDGVRAIVDNSAAAVRLVSRNGNDVTATFPELEGLADVLHGHRLALDGEIVALDDSGRPSFSKLQERLGVTGAEARRRARGNPVALILFDLLHLDGFSTRGLPLRDRRALLTQLELPAGAQWRFSDQHADGKALLEATKAIDLEGVIAKKAESMYLPGQRTTAWVKVKNVSADEFVIGGWLTGNGRREHMIGALMLGVPETDDPEARLRYVGRAGTGFTVAELERLHALLAPSRSTTSPFVNDPHERGAVFVTPRLRCRVEYREWTPQGILRHPSYKGLVTDPAPDTPEPTHTQGSD